MLEHYSPLLALAVTVGYAAQLGSPWQPQPVLPMGVAGIRIMSHAPELGFGIAGVGMIADCHAQAIKDARGTPH